MAAPAGTAAPGVADSRTALSCGPGLTLVSINPVMMLGPVVSAYGSSNSIMEMKLALEGNEFKTLSNKVRAQADTPGWGRRAACSACWRPRRRSTLAPARAACLALQRLGAPCRATAQGHRAGVTPAGRRRQLQRQTKHAALRRVRSSAVPTGGDWRPRSCVQLCDIRDGARAHIVAAERPEASGRYLVGLKNTVDHRTVTNILQVSQRPQGYGSSS